MTQVANIRVNMGAPWPAVVKGSAPVTISRQNGIWTVGFSIANLPELPVGLNPSTVTLLAYNTIAGVFAQVTVAQLLASGVTPTPISAVNSPYTPLASDTALDVDTSGGPVEIDLTASAARSGADLVIKDVTGNGAANNITVKPVAGAHPETIDGYTNAAPLVLDANYGGVRLSPRTLKYVIAP